MKNKSCLVIIFFLLLWAMSGCKAVQHVQQTRAVSEEPPFEVQVPHIEEIEDSDLPGDIRMVTAAIVQKMRMETSGIPGVSFDPSGFHYTPDGTFNYDGFAVSRFTLIDHWANDTGRNSFACWIEGGLLFVDQLGRTAMVEMVADYELFQDRIIINRSMVRPVPPLFPNAMAFIIEEHKLKRIVDQRPDFPRLFLEVTSNAHNMTPSPDERRLRDELQEMSFFQRMRHTPPQERQDNYMVIFLMDRMMPDAELEVVVNRSLHGRNSEAKVNHFDFNGWRVAIFGGHFAIDRDDFYARVYYKPGPGVLPDDLDQVLVGLFSTEKNYDLPDRPSTVQIQPTTQIEAKPVVHTPAEGPLASGQMFLNPADHDDARIIQTRLAELGFYNSAIDGLWGPGSRGALQSFQRSVNFPVNGEWTMQSQMRLFSGTGK